METPGWAGVGWGGVRRGRRVGTVGCQFVPKLIRDGPKVLPDRSLIDPTNVKHWAPVSEPGFLDFQIFDSLDFLNIFLKNMLVRYRGIDNKRRPGETLDKMEGFEAISTTLKCQFTVKC